MAWLRRGLRRCAGTRVALPATLVATAALPAGALDVIGVRALSRRSLPARPLALAVRARFRRSAAGLDRVDRACLAIQHPLDGLGCTIGQLTHPCGQHHAMALELELQPQVAVDVISGCGEGFVEDL